MLSDGVIREAGATEKILHAPTHPYTQSLIAAVTPNDAERGGEVRRPAAPAPLLDVRGAIAGYGGRAANGWPAKVILHEVDLRIGRGQTVGVIGESGSGKTTLAKVIAGLVPATGGEILLDGVPLARDIGKRTKE